MATRDPLLKRVKESVGKKRGRRHSVLQDQETIEAVCLAELGKNNDLIQGRGIKLTESQIQYRLTQAKMKAGYKKGDGFRKAWREGRSNYEEVVTAVLPELRRNYEKEILPQVNSLPVKGAEEAKAKP